MSLVTKKLFGIAATRLGSVSRKVSLRKYHRDFYHSQTGKNASGDGSTDMALSALCGVGILVASTSSSSLDMLEHYDDMMGKNGRFCCCESNDDDEADRFQRTLKHHQRHFEDYKQKWDWNSVKSRIPTASWPYDVPSVEDVGMFRTEMLYCNNNSSSTTTDNDNEYCDNTRFRVATYWLQNGNYQEKVDAMKIIKELAEQRNHADAMCSYAICWNEGRGGLEINPGRAVSWWQLARDKYDHVQSMYELGVALYTGEGVPEDESQAVEYFRDAADNGHAGAAYMLGDCLLDGIGCEQDRAEALEWLVIAADLGHRGARSRVLAVLEKKEGVNYGRFTDASRQTFVEDALPKPSTKSSISTTTTAEESKDILSTITKTPQQRPLLYERKFTIGGGARNPVVLARRKTIVVESRQQ